MLLISKDAPNCSTVSVDTKYLDDDSRVQILDAEHYSSKNLNKIKNHISKDIKQYFSTLMVIINIY